MSNTVDSTSDNRTANNAVLHNYRVLSDAEKQQPLQTDILPGEARRI